MQQGRTAGLAIFLGLIVSVTGCGSTGPDDSWSARDKELDAARARWEASGIKSYSYTELVTCSCSYGNFPVRVKVSNGTIIVVTKVSDGTSVPEGTVQSYHTVEELFALVESAINQHAVTYQVSFDGTRGYPTEIDIDFKANVETDAIAVSISGFAQE